jgi:hypothetical protein
MPNPEYQTLKIKTGTLNPQPLGARNWGGGCERNVRERVSNGRATGDYKPYTLRPEL